MGAGLELDEEGGAVVEEEVVEERRAGGGGGEFDRAAAEAKGARGELGDEALADVDDLLRA